MSSEKLNGNPVLAAKISRMALRLCPLVQVNTSLPHPQFPSTLLNYWLLTSDQLDGLAQFYHQRTVCEWTFQYPCPVNWDGDLSLEGKRRKFGRFIGLRGCETPIVVKSEEDIMREARSERESGGEEALRRKLMWYS